MTIIAIDGPTGAGKSTTARLVAEQLDAHLLLDPVSVSPLLDTYYTGEATPAAALDSELAFLRSRATLLAAAPPGRLSIADFSVMRTAPFAEFLADPSNRQAVIAELRTHMETLPTIDVLVLLEASADALIERVRTRDRGAEADLTKEHLDELRSHFATWNAELVDQAHHVIVIDTATWDPHNPGDLDALVARLRAELN